MTTKYPHQKLSFFIKNQTNFTDNSLTGESMKIGKLEKVDLREIWKNEARDFTTWLYENISGLSDAVNLTLQAPEKEKQVEGSRFCIDILAETDEGEGVIIENQLEQTDHKHLGQIITYITNMECSHAIWIVKEPRQEHINAINWLNEVSDKNFYLVKLEAFKIGDSEPAPFFSVICSPEEDIKELGKDKKEILIERKARNQLKDNADTIIVPSQKDGFEKVFIGENRWYAIRISKSRIHQFKYIAAYQISPLSAVTHIAKIKEIRQYQDSDKFEILFEAPAEKIKPIKLGESKNSPQGPVYCKYDDFKDASCFEDLMGKDKTTAKKAA